MPEATVLDFNLQDKSPAEIEQRRREIIAELDRFPGGMDDPDVPMPLLHELAVVCARLRRRTSGAPAVAKPKKVPKKATLDDLMSHL